MIDGSEKRKRQLVFELHSSCVYEKHSNWIVKKKKYKNGICSPNGNFRLITEKTEDDGIGV